LLGDMKGASSVAHIYGQNLVAAESMTSIGAPWAHAPSDLRRIIDMEFAHGVNLPVIHTSPHQPLDDKQPGVSLAIFGQFFTRHETWADMAKPWVDYMARSSYLLQQGRNHADMAIFVGEDEPVTGQHFRGVPADLPRENAYDFISADALATVVSVADGQILTKGGARYGVMYLGKASEQMTLPTLRRLADLVDGGAKVAGHRPISSPSKADDKAAFDALVADLWDNNKIITAASAQEALDKTAIAPDFTYSRSDDAQILFVHRALTDGEIYFVNNREAKAVSTEARFRVTGKRPEIWDAVTGQSRAVGYRIEDGQTIVTLNMAAEESFFVVFRDPATTDAAAVSERKETTIGTFNTEWLVAFQSGRGAPDSAAMKMLAPLNENQEAGIKYFSGTARYTKSIALKSTPVKGERLILDLGQIGDVAQVWVNGTLVGTAWFPPYRVDVTGHLVKGKNAIEIRVANKWVNRLIGDAQQGASKIAFAAIPTYAPDAPLRPSGLIGPVRLISQK
jgi:alpha-L-rhamnosidase